MGREGVGRSGGSGMGDLRRAFASSMAANVSSRLMRNHFEAVSRQRRCHAH
jgi:hypothetical protein